MRSELTKIEELKDDLLSDFAQFLHVNLQVSRTQDAWITGLRHHWLDNQPNYGFVLRQSGQIVGGIGAYYVQRYLNGQLLKFCNITSWCVLDEFRQHSMRLALTLLNQRDFCFTDFSPSKVVGNTLRFLNFKELDERVAVILNIPFGAYRDMKVIDLPSQIQSELHGNALKIFLDHSVFPWLEHLLIGCPGNWCHVIYKRRRFKKTPSATILYLSDPDVFTRSFPRMAAYFIKNGLFTTHLDYRFLEKIPGLFRVRAGFNKKLFLSKTLNAGDIDYL